MILIRKLLKRILSKAQKRIIVSEKDCEGLVTMIKHYEYLYPHTRLRAFKRFKKDIKNAIVVKNCKMPSDIAKINSHVLYKTKGSNIKRTVQLVYPIDENLKMNKLSVFSAVGMSLFAKSSGDLTDCFLGDRKIEIEIIDILQHKKFNKVLV